MKLKWHNGNHTPTSQHIILQVYVPAALESLLLDQDLLEAQQSFPGKALHNAITRRHQYKFKTGLSDCRLRYVFVSYFVILFADGLAVMSLCFRVITLSI